MGGGFRIRSTESQHPQYLDPFERVCFDLTRRRGALLIGQLKQGLKRLYLFSLILCQQHIGVGQFTGGS